MSGGVAGVAGRRAPGAAAWSRTNQDTRTGQVDGRRPGLVGTAKQLVRAGGMVLGWLMTQTHCLSGNQIRESWTVPLCTV